MKKSVVIASPIYQKPEILKEFLTSLEELNVDQIEIAYLFVDDNKEEASKRLLRTFKETHEKVTVIESDEDIEYVVDDFTHRWNEKIIEKVTRFKNHMIEIALEKEYDYIFFIDSDIVLHPQTIKQLISDEKDIISNIFWTKWGPNAQSLPQVWMQDAYSFHTIKSNELSTAQEMQKQTEEFLGTLRKAGVYKVGGLGACTLISRKALLTGVNFSDIYNVSFWGEDRYFCIRAVALGLELFVDTHYPAYHIYREEDLNGVTAYKDAGKGRDAELLIEHIVGQVVEGVNQLLTFSYEQELEDHFSCYFTEVEAKRLKEKLEKDRKKIISQKIINTCQVLDCEVTLVEKSKEAKVDVRYSYQGYRRGYSYKEQYEGVCLLEADEKGNYIIRTFEPTNQFDLGEGYFIRRISEKPHLTVSMCVKNEEGRYLERVLEAAKEYANQFVIIDDGSTDKTIQICKDLLGERLTLIQNTTSKFANETLLRKQQWYETISTHPDWMLFLDADEVFEERAKEVIPRLMREREVDVYAFRLYDFWDEENYRQDKLWYAHHTYRGFMTRFQRQYQYTFTETPQHCGRMPSNISNLATKTSDLRLKHYGWAKGEDRIQKFRRYMALDPEGKYGVMDQYRSILDPYPNLVKWSETAIEQ